MAMNDSDLRTLGFSTIRAVKEMQRLIMQCKNEANGPSVMLCPEEPPGHYYDPLRGSGFIENKLKTLRKQMAIEDKMYKKQKRSHSTYASSSSFESSEDADTSGSTVELDASLLEDDSPILKKIKWLKETTPNKDNKAGIYNIMKESHDYRRLEIQLKPMTLTDILEKYPRFCDAYEGGLIDCEFEMNYPECKKFMEIFPPLIQKILKMDQDCVQCDDGRLQRWILC
uniref:uncharacterized protein LOC120328193 isoform X2 n=1 Tax=Styela clava TaxID=7725 RepID=UPI001939EACC|nr:uncharacterized protein LOC120328193 isoform X2 [Styela clava]